jgi:phosphopantetheinyl transferase (holo-ACP synthase)
MPLVGNDVVDLDDPAILRSHLQGRFVARVCTEAERVALATAKGGKTLLWSLFAAKEAAYKVAAKQGPAPGFAHRRFEVAPDLGSVRDAVTGQRMHLWVEVDTVRGFVHAVAAEGAERPVHAVAEVPEGQDPSAAVRDELAAAAALRLGGERMAYAVERAADAGSWDGFAPPRLLHGGRAVPGADLSLSHDGRFVAWAMAIF